MKSRYVLAVAVAIIVSADTWAQTAEPQDAFQLAMKTIAEEENFRSCPYDDLAPQRRLLPSDRILGTLSVGFGQTGSNVKVGECITEPQARELLEQAVEKTSRLVDHAIDRDMTKEQEVGWISFFYNVGPAAVSSSAVRLFNEGDGAAACAALQLWTMSNGVHLSGLRERRLREARLIDPTCIALPLSR